MDHADHVELIRAAVNAGETWADIGAGNGAFTLALADLLGPTATIFAVDRDRRALEEAARRVRASPRPPTLQTLVGDFENPLALPTLDGIVMGELAPLRVRPVAGAPGGREPASAGRLVRHRRI